MIQRIQKIICPLCLSPNPVLEENIRLSNLITRYNKWLAYDVRSEFDTIKRIDLCHCLDCDVRFFFPTVAGSEKFYEKLQDVDGYYADNKSEYENAKQYINSCDSLLEIGCGKGAFAKNISPRKYIGLEISQKAVDAAIRSGIEAKKETIQEHAKNNVANYDIVCAFQVLEHVADVHSFIEASLTCLKPQGLLIYSIPSADSFISYLKSSLTNLPPHHVTWWSDECLKNIDQIFGIKMLHLEHELLANEDKEFYIQSIILASIENVFGFKATLGDMSIRYKLAAKISRWGAKFLKTGLRDHRVLPRGHTVTVVYRK